AVDALEQVGHVPGDDDGAEHPAGALAALDLLGEVRLALDAPALRILHAVARAAHEQPVVDTRDEVLERPLAGAEERVAHARVRLARDALPAPVGGPRHAELRRRDEVGHGALQDALL